MLLTTFQSVAPTTAVVVQSLRRRGTPSCKQAKAATTFLLIPSCVRQLPVRDGPNLQALNKRVVESMVTGETAVSAMEADVSAISAVHQRTKPTRPHRNTS